MEDKNAYETAIPDVPHHPLELDEFQKNTEKKSQKDYRILSLIALKLRHKPKLLMK